VDLAAEVKKDQSLTTGPGQSPQPDDDLEPETKTAAKSI